MKKIFRRPLIQNLLILVILAAVTYCLLAFWPERKFPEPSGAKSEPFTWNRGELFTKLEKQFTVARKSPEETAEEKFAEVEQKTLDLLQKLSDEGDNPSKDTLDSLEKVQYRLAAQAAAKPVFMSRFQKLQQQIRITVMKLAVKWSLSPKTTHEVLYRIVVGGRTAMEEALAQQSLSTKPTLEKYEDIPSSCPSSMAEGVRFHSGDLLLSRGDAPTSALIARGSSFPGGFSHVAMVYIPENGKSPLILESLIESGSTITPIDKFMDSHRHRLVLLRVRPGTPENLEHPELPMMAAETLYARFKEENVPYDFAMQPDDASALFCADAVYQAYRDAGMSLWPQRSHLDTPGIIRLLGPIGVQQFVTLTPQDLELDPRLGEVAEWRFLDQLRKDRIESALLDVLISASEDGAHLKAPRYILAASRLLRGFSNIQEFFGFEPTLPEGMTASSAARLEGFRHHVYPVLFRAISAKATAFKRAKGYNPPTWVLREFAQEALKENRENLKKYFG